MFDRDTSSLRYPKPHLCAMYAREARDVYPDCSWQEVEPLLRRAWENGINNIEWRRARSMVKSCWLEQQRPTV